MPEIKHTFTAGKMNKDIDERLVKNGEYRDALNIQVRTTDGDSNGLGDSGTAQNIEGNTKIAELYTITGYNGDSTKIIGSVGDEKNDRAFFFAAAPVPGEGISSINPTTIVEASLNDDGDLVAGQSERIWVDSIMEVNPSNESVPIFIDRFAMTSITSDVMTDFPLIPASGYSSIMVTDGTKYRIGMIIYAQETSGNNLLSNGNSDGVEIISIILNDDGDDELILAAEQTADLENDATVMMFVHKERVLEFNYHKLIKSESMRGRITGINIIDDLLFWTHSKMNPVTKKLEGTEPKKINIKRSKEGTTADNYLTNPKHTKLYVQNPIIGNLVAVSGDLDSVESLDTPDIKKEHITVIRRAPKSPPTLYIRDTDRALDTNFSLIQYQFVQEDSTPSVPSEGSIRIITFPAGIDFRMGDVFTFTEASNNTNPIILRAQVVSSGVGLADVSSEVQLKLLFVDEELEDQNPSEWSVELEQKKPLFETKFGRVAYRYQYEDNEYSSFSPWSELAFLPGDFAYTPSKGFNEGMANNLRQFVIRDFIPNDSIRPSDVKTIDILWKTTDSANVYLIKSIRREINSEWENFSIGNISDNTGSMTITSEMIHRVLPANQTLRAWDNVPRKAVAQEMTANRLVYGNYIQGYDINTTFGLKQSIVSQQVDFPKPLKSAKSMRNYKFGVIFGDKYGRETPVIADGYKTNLGETITGDLSIEKKLSHYSNKFKLEQSWNPPEPMEWMDYIKYYVKETSNEYYNLVLDRWYDAGDGNVWLSFASVDRNKIDEETYLILKNAHGNQRAVTEEARYKVIAIKNEAPDYIRTDNRDFDKILINRDNVYGEAAVTDGSPWKLISSKNKTTINFDSTEWEESGIKAADFKGTPKARIVGEWYNSTDTSGNPVGSAQSPWKTVSRLITGSDTTEPGIVIKKAFTGGEVNMFQRISSGLDDPSQITVANVDNEGDADYIFYYLELRDAVVENKPEFDGRFFVKIERDDTLRTRVLGGSQGNYEILNTYEVAYIRNIATNPAESDADEIDVVGDNASFAWPSTNISAFTNSNIESTVNVADINDIIADAIDQGIVPDSTATVPAFGPGNPTLTEAFWFWWWNQRSADIFIDHVPAYKGYSYMTNLEGANSPRQVLEFLGSGFSPISNFQNGEIYGPDINFANQATWEAFEPNQNWEPSGLSPGSANNGERGQLTFSVIQNEWTGASSIFKSQMQQPGTIFRFAADPNSNYYKVISFVQQVDSNPFYQGLGGFSNPIEIDFSYNFPITDAIPGNFMGNMAALFLVRRYSIITRFARLDGSGNVIENSGVDISLWDPRGELQQNGVGSMTIEVVQRTEDEDLSEDTITTNAACWETEPKQNVDVDIYYEASGAIPVKLKNAGDLITFTKAGVDREMASDFSANTRTLIAQNNNGNALTEEINLTNNPWVLRTLGDDGIAVATGIIIQGVTFPTELTTQVNGNVANGLAINDEISFIHKDGLITQSKVLDHYKLVSIGDIEVTELSDRYTFNNGSPVSIQLPPQQGGAIVARIEFPWSLGLLSDLEVGMEVIGDGIERGTFITEIFDSVEPQYDPYVQLNKPMLPGDIGVFTFITVTGWFKIDKDVWKYPIELGWFNCYSFGNGVESDRIRDDFNAPMIDNGIKVSSTFLEYGEETMGSGLIYSGLYNSTSSVNDLNEFNMAEKITKNLNPIYGSVQSMKARDGDMVVLAEDKILKVQSNKDAVYNADNNPQIIATNKVLGATIPFAGDYGISQNPESLAVDQYRMYFTDKQRGAVLRLSGNGITPISNVGMQTYFRERLKMGETIIGTFDIVDGEYNVTLNTAAKFQGGDGASNPSTTISFNEQSKGWTSFKSFIPLSGVSITGRYITANTNKIWEHYSSSTSRNNFYGTQYTSEIEVLFNDSPGSVKSFKTINYEGSQAKIIKHTNIDNATSLTTFTDAAGNVITDLTDGNYYNLTGKNGWYVESFNTDLQEGKVSEFINKENKWFNKINGVATTLSNLDTSEFSVQGIGNASSITSTSATDATITITDTN